MKAELEQERERREKKRDERKEAKERRDKEEVKKAKEPTPSSKNAGAGAGAGACVYAYEEHPTVADEQATGRIFASLDYDADEKDRRRIMRNALLRLKRNDRNFARAVLGGATHRELGISRQAFAKKMSKILKAVLTKTKKNEKSCRAPINIG